MILSGCGHLKLNIREEIDEPVCVEFNLEKGGCTKIISGERFVVDEKNLYEGKTWFELRPYMVRIPVKTYKSLKAFLIKICKKYSCDKEVSSWDRAIINIDAMIEQKEVTK